MSTNFTYTTYTTLSPNSNSCLKQSSLRVEGLSSDGPPRALPPRSYVQFLLGLLAFSIEPKRYPRLRLISRYEAQDPPGAVLLPDFCYMVLCCGQYIKPRIPLELIKPHAGCLKLTLRVQAYPKGPRSQMMGL